MFKLFVFQNFRIAGPKACMHFVEADTACTFASDVATNLLLEGTAEVCGTLNPTPSHCHSVELGRASDYCTCSALSRTLKPGLLRKF